MKIDLFSERMFVIMGFWFMCICFGGALAIILTFPWEFVNSFKERAMQAEQIGNKNRDLIIELQQNIENLAQEVQSVKNVQKIDHQIIQRIIP